MRPVKRAFWIESHTDANTVVVRVGGEVDLSSGERLRAALEAAEARVRPPAPVVLDLSAVTFFGSPGWRLLADHYRRCLAMGSDLRILARGTAVRRALETVGMDWLLPPGPASTDRRVSHD